MFRQRRWRRGASILAALAACLGSAAVSTAATLPARAEVRIGGTLDINTFEQSVADRYGVHFRKVIATDIDRDGDMDFVAAGDAGLVVFVNDGDGHLTSETPTRMPLGAGGSSGTSWQDRDDRLDLSIQNASPSVPLPRVYAHGPPPIAVRRRLPSVTSAWLQVLVSSRSPRAPPA